MINKKFVPFTEEPEGILERIESLETFRDSGYSDHANLVNALDNNVDELRRSVERISRDVDVLESDFKDFRLYCKSILDELSDGRKTKKEKDDKKYGVLTMQIDTQCPKCNSKKIYVDGSLGSTAYIGFCDDCGNKFEIFPE